ncbi:hypothetical protein EDB80DRAFT_869353 [Ilyonectria destructans]|nr:hypothetical protein EDB80DRAFT_869353 [Ilyonectria destructans]
MAQSTPLQLQVQQLQHAQIEQQHLLHRLSSEVQVLLKHQFQRQSHDRPFSLQQSQPQQFQRQAPLRHSGPPPCPPSFQQQLPLQPPFKLNAVESLDQSLQLCLYQTLQQLPSEILRQQQQLEWRLRCQQQETLGCFLRELQQQQQHFLEKMRDGRNAGNASHFTGSPDASGTAKPYI